MRPFDVIAALSTPPGISGVALIRMSGEGVLEIADRVFRGKQKPSETPTHRVLYGYIIDPETGERVDDVLLTVMRRPKSYTGEDVVEISCHGGRVVPSLVLETLIKAGARLAEPGEFTKRAFLNGKMDLLQAQGLMELVMAVSKEGARMARRKLEGETSEYFKKTREIFLTTLREFEARLDFPEDVPELEKNEAMELISALKEHLEELLERGREGRRFLEGVNVVIAGKPNVGKSTLFNTLLGRERAIVTEIPGTTRDTISEEIILGGIPIKLYDTAGWREVKDMIEKMGIEKTEERIGEASLVLFVIDVSGELEREDIELYEKIKGDKIIVLNKIDLGHRVDLKGINIEGVPIFKVSSLYGTGIDELKKGILSHISSGISEPDFGISRREEGLLLSSLMEVKEALKKLEEGMPLDIITHHLRESMKRIDEIIGIGDIPEAILNEIFSNFCIGK
jgi:tRNA modification GTPase